MGEALLVRKGGGKTSDPNLIASNIKKGIQIFDVTGTYLGELESKLGFTKSAINTFTVSSDSYAYKNTIPHSLGVRPKFYFLIAPKFSLPNSSNSYLINEIGELTAFDTTSGVYLYVSKGYYSSSINASGSSFTWNEAVTASNIKLQSVEYLRAGITYTLCTFA